MKTLDRAAQKVTMRGLRCPHSDPSSLRQRQRAYCRWGTMLGIFCPANSVLSPDPFGVKVGSVRSGGLNLFLRADASRTCAFVCFRKQSEKDDISTSAGRFAGLLWAPDAFYASWAARADRDRQDKRGAEGSQRPFQAPLCTEKVFFIVKKIRAVKTGLPSCFQIIPRG